jgi:hypothetical protein
MVGRYETYSNSLANPYRFYVIEVFLENSNKMACKVRTNGREDKFFDSLAEAKQWCNQIENELIKEAVG